MKILLLFSSFVLLTGCGSTINPSKHVHKPTDKFSLVASTDGKVYRLDRKTGEVALIGPDGIRIIGSPKDPLGILK